MDCSLSGLSVHEIFQARVLERVAISFSRESSQPRDQTWVSRFVGRCFYCLSQQGSQCFIGGFKSFITILDFPGGTSGKEPEITDFGEKSYLYIRSTMNQESTCFHLKYSDNNLLSEKEHTHTHITSM